MLELGKVLNLEITEPVLTEESRSTSEIDATSKWGCGWHHNWSWLKTPWTMPRQSCFRHCRGGRRDSLGHIEEELSRREVRVPVAAIRFELERQTARAMREFPILQPSRSAPVAMRSAA